MKHRSFFQKWSQYIAVDQQQEWRMKYSNINSKFEHVTFREENDARIVEISPMEEIQTEDNMPVAFTNMLPIAFVDNLFLIDYTYPLTFLLFTCFIIQHFYSSYFSFKN